MNLLIIAILTVLANYIFKKVIEFIRVQDENLTLKTKEKVVIIISYLIFISLFLIKYRTSEFVFYYLTILYLVITAFIDFKTSDVYKIINIFMGINSIVYLLYLLSLNVDITENIGGILVTTILGIIFTKLDVWAWGDSEIFIVIAPFIATHGYIYILINFFISLVLSGIVNILRSIFTGFRLPTRQSFAPYITVSSLLVMFIR